MIDWTGLPAVLDSLVFETSSEYDALNRVTKLTLPENVNQDKKDILPQYNRAGALEKVSYDGNVYVENIAYNAKGQRLLIAFGNDIMTRYTYDSTTFRLLRQRSEKFTKTQEGSTITYAYQSGNNKQDDGFEYDLVGNILKILHRVNDCGINGTVLGSNALDREFEYDPLNRLLSATGRESDTQNQNDYLYTDAPAPGTPNANNVQAYTRKYKYDKMGNVLQVKQQGNNGFTRNFGYFTDVNTLEKISDINDILIEDFTYDTCGNQITAGANRHYIWSAANRLLVYKNQTGSSDPTIFAQYDYDGAGNRISKLVRTGNGSPTYTRTIYIDGIFEYHILENGTTYEKNYVHVMDASTGSAQASRIAMVRVGDAFPDDITESVIYNLENQIKSSSARLDTNGTVIDREEYYPFGDSSMRTFTKKRYRYVGKEKDLESGLYYYGARYYSAWTCRFISVDPIAFKFPFQSPYTYADNNPIMKNDPTGMAAEGSGDPPKSENGGGNDDWWDNDPNKSFDLPEVVIRPEDTTGTDSSSKPTYNWSSETSESAFGGSFQQYLEMYNLPNDFSYLQAVEWQKGALKDWNKSFGLPEETSNEVAFEEWYKVTDNYQQDQAQKASGLLLGGYIMAAQLEVFALNPKNPFSKAPTGPKSVTKPKVDNIRTKAPEGVLKYEQRTLQHMFSRHAKDFGVTANWSKTTATKFLEVLKSHMRGVKPIQGTYRGTQKVLHYFDSKTGLNVMTDLEGNLVGGWKLSADQIKYLQKAGSIK